MLKKILFILGITSIFLNAQDSRSIAYFGYSTMSYANSKESILAGATTATAKGYNALLTNPAGLSTNECWAIYARTAIVQKKTGESDRVDEDQIILSENAASEYIAGGVIFDSFAIETRPSDYIAGGYGFGIESQWGLFSFGMSIYQDQTDMVIDTEIGPTFDQNNEFAMGDHYNFGFMWQKTFLSPDDFYGFYFGVSYKTSGKNETKSEYIISSPKEMGIGIGFSTNFIGTTLMVTSDYKKEEWDSINETLTGIAVGIKWMIFEGFAIGTGINKQTFDGSSTFDTIDTMAFGIELNIWKIGTNISVMRKDINALDGSTYLEEDSAHVDLYITF